MCTGVLDSVVDGLGNMSKRAKVATAIVVEAGEADAAEDDAVVVTQARHLHDQRLHDMRGVIAVVEPAMQPDEVQSIVSQHLRGQRAGLRRRNVDDHLFPSRTFRQDCDLPGRSDHEPRRPGVERAPDRVRVGVVAMHDDA